MQNDEWKHKGRFRVWSLIHHSSFCIHHFPPFSALTPPARRLKTAPMRYVIKEKLIALGDDFKIRDENGNDVFFVDGRALSFGDKLSFKDMRGNELAFIDQKLLSWGPTYEIFRGDRRAAMVKKKLFTLFNARFTVDVPGPDDLEAKGDFLEHEYTFARGGREVAQVSKRWFSFTHTYGVDIAPGEDDVLILATAIVIDLCLHKEKHD